jgi:hypothetical protein
LVSLFIYYKPESLKIAVVVFKQANNINRLMKKGGWKLLIYAMGQLFIRYVIYTGFTFKPELAFPFFNNFS